MDRVTAIKLSGSIQAVLDSGLSLDVTETAHVLRGVDRECLLSFEIRDEERYTKVEICNWNRKNPDNYYLMVYGKDGQKLCEIHETDGKEMFWQYSPKNRDTENNLQRKRNFIHMYGSLVTRTSLPNDNISVDEFLQDLLTLAVFRSTAGDLSVDYRGRRNDVFPEGRRIEKIHKYRERSSQIVVKAKEQHFKANGNRLPCEVCNFDFFEKYGDRGFHFIEAHHKVPLHSLDQMRGTETKVEDLAMVCANCHRMLHRGSTIDVECLKEALHEKSD